MYRPFLVILLFLLSSGCIASSTIKDASTKHASNLVGIQQAIAEYRKKLNAYYDRLIQAQREAHIAMHLHKSIDAMADDQASSIASKLVATPNSQEPAKDFIHAGASITGNFDFWGRDFDQWVEGKSLDDHRKALKEEAANAEKAGDQEAAMKLRAKASKKDEDDDLTFVSNAMQFKHQREQLDAELTLLAAQNTTMQAFHAKINEFLAIDATIDGARIAAAAAAGSKADVTGILKSK